MRPGQAERRFHDYRARTARPLSSIGVEALARHRHGSRSSANVSRAIGPEMFSHCCRVLDPCRRGERPLLISTIHIVNQWTGCLGDPQDQGESASRWFAINGRAGRPISRTRSSASWLNRGRAAGQFGLLTDKQIQARRCHRSHQGVGAHHPPRQLAHRPTNQNPKPFKWTKSADDILAIAIQRFCLRTIEIVAEFSRRKSCELQESGSTSVSAFRMLCRPENSST